MNGPTPTVAPAAPWTHGDRTDAELMAFVRACGRSITPLDMDALEDTVAASWLLGRLETRKHGRGFEFVDPLQRAELLGGGSDFDAYDESVSAYDGRRAG